MGILRVTLDSWRDLAQATVTIPGDEPGDQIRGTILMEATVGSGGVLAPSLHSVPPERDDGPDHQGIVCPWSADLVDPTDAQPSGWGWRIALRAPGAPAIIAILTPEAIAAVTPVDGVRTMRLEDHIGLSDTLGTGGIVTPLPGIKGDPGSPTAYELRGTGSPYGVVTPASAGVYYTDTLGTCGAWRWMSTGTTNTSWTVITGDTGWRDMRATVSDWGNLGMASTPFGFVIRRVNADVWLGINGIRASDTAKHDKVYTLPYGFRGLGTNEDNRFFPVTTDVAQMPLGQIGIRESQYLQFWFSSIGEYRSVNGLWVTADAWPTTLPGTAA